MVNCKSRPDTPAGTVKMGVHQRRTAHVIAWEFIPGRVLTFTNMKTLTTIPAPEPVPIASGINVEIRIIFSFVVLAMYLVDLVVKETSKDNTKEHGGFLKKLYFFNS